MKIFVRCLAKLQTAYNLGVAINVIARVAVQGVLVRVPIAKSSMAVPILTHGQQDNLKAGGIYLPLIY